MFTFPAIPAKIFKEKALQNKFEENGFIIIEFLNKTAVDTLQQFYHSITINQSMGFEPTTYFQDDEYRIKASNEILTIAKPYLDEHLINYKMFMGSFIVKHPDNKSELGVHQDMTLVDESKFTGINIWIPLCDTNEQNGALHVIPKSHRILPTYRAATIPNIYDRYSNEIKKYMQPVYMKKGQAILFDNSLLHFSPINKSNEKRIACNIFVTHKDAKITICYNDTEKNKIELIEQDDSFFTTYKQFDNGSMERPKTGRSIGYTDYNFPVLNPKMLNSENKHSIKKNWKEKLTAIFK